MNVAEEALDQARRPLVALLERELAAGAAELSSGGSVATRVPARLWETALLGPLREFLNRPGKELRGRMVELGFVLGGGGPGGMPETLPLLLEILHAGSLIIDDIEDDSLLRRGKPTLHRSHGLGVALNAGNWLYFWPQVLLSRMSLSSTARLEAHERISECLLRCHEGQALDLTVRIDDLPRHEVGAVVRATTTLKTGQLVGLACALGAIAAGATTRRIDALACFGSAIGVGLQMLDDLSGILNPNRRDKAIEDLKQGRATWVWAWLAEEPDAARYRDALELLRSAREQTANQDEAAAQACYAALLEHARFRLSMTGVRRTRRAVDEALTTLTQAVGEGEWTHVVRAELAALERAFMEGA